MKNVEAKVIGGGLILNINNKGEASPFGNVVVEFFCPNCETRNEYTMDYRCTSVLFQQEKKCTYCEEEYNLQVKINLEPSVTFNE